MKILSTIAAMFVGGGVAVVSTYGLVSSQTSAPAKSPTSVNSSVFEYGSNN